MTATNPSWWVPADQQLLQAQKLWPNITLPDPPEFTPLTKSEVLLLHVPDDFTSLWEKASEHHYAYERGDSILTEWHLRLNPNRREFVEPTWVAFDPEHEKEVSPATLWNKENLAASEVLSAIIQFPDWPLEWIDADASRPYLSGYQLERNGQWSDVPAIMYNRPDRSSPSGLYLHRVEAGSTHHPFAASPTVRRVLR
jgi:hypothetical protein